MCGTQLVSRVLSPLTPDTQYQACMCGSCLGHTIIQSEGVMFAIIQSEGLMFACNSEGAWEHYRRKPLVTQSQLYRQYSDMRESERAMGTMI